MSFCVSLPALVPALSVCAVQQTFTSSEGDFLSFNIIGRREDKSFMEETERSGDITDTILRNPYFVVWARLIFVTGGILLFTVLQHGPFTPNSMS